MAGGRPKGSKNKWHQSPEERKAYMENYRKTHKEEQAIRWQRYKKDNPEKIKVKYLNHKDEIKAKRLAYRIEIKRNVFDHYSNGEIKCCRCGFTDIRALSIDHINGGGTNHRKVLNRSGESFYRWLKMNNYPEGFQVLCMNCQWLKKAEKREYRGIAQGAIW